MSTTTLQQDQANDQANGHQDPRALRGVQLYRERGEEIMHNGGSVYLVPASGREPAYLVDTDKECCTCPDYQIRQKALPAKDSKTSEKAEPCKHVYATMIVRAKDHAEFRRRQAERDAERITFTTEQIEANLARMEA